MQTVVDWRKPATCAACGAPTRVATDRAMGDAFKSFRMKSHEPGRRNRSRTYYTSLERFDSTAFQFVVLAALGCHLAARSSIAVICCGVNAARASPSWSRFFSSLRALSNDQK